MTQSVDGDQFARLVALAQQATLAPSRWEWFLQALSETSGGARVQLFSHDMQSDEPLGYYEHGHDPDFLESYLTHFGKINPWIRAFSHIDSGRVSLGNELVPDDQLVQTEFYNDWVRPQEDIIGSAAAVLHADSRRVTAIAANIRRKDREKVEPRIRDILQTLLPHLRHAIEISNALGTLTLENLVLWTGMDPHVAAVFVVDHAGRLHFANARGEALADRSDCVKLDSRARLHFADPRGELMLARALHERSLHGVSVALPFFVRNGDRENFVCRTLPIDVTDGPFPWICSGNSQARDLCMVILTPVSPRLSRSEHLKSPS